MDKRTLIPHGKDMHASRGVGRPSGFPSGRGVKGKAMRGAIDVVTWESAFHAERGCLSCTPSPGHSQPHPQH
jgi:hypothetical protein